VEVENGALFQNPALAVGDTTIQAELSLYSLFSSAFASGKI
jgi:hypothetical protein